jgi:hypothetical protein
MFFGKTLNKKFTLKQQKKLARNFLRFVVPGGYGIGQVLTIIILGWTKYHFGLYHFGVYNFISTIIIDFLICSPYFINIIKYTKRYNYAVKFFERNKNPQVKCVYDCVFFEVGEIYTLVLKDNVLHVSSEGGTWYQYRYYMNYKEVVNKFELIDLKGERLKKLKKLKSRF